MKATRLSCVASLILFLCLPAWSQSLSFDAGEPVSLTVGQIPSGYTTYWVSSLDGYFAQGNSFTETLSVGYHTITAYIYRNADARLVYNGSIDVEVLAPTQPTPTPTPSAGSYAPGEFEEVTELLLGCNDVYMVQDLYPQFLSALTGTVRTTIYADNSYVRNELEDLFWRNGLSNANYAIELLALDSIWMRDYGPLFVKGSSGLEVVDLAYYPGRYDDDRMPARFAQSRGMSVRDLPVYWEGGNYTSDGQGGVYSTDIVYDYTNASNASIKNAVEEAFDADELYTFPEMLDDGGTGHLDMFFLLVGPRRVMLNRFPSWHQNYQRMENTASRLRGLGFDVVRLDLADTRYNSHSNALLVNGIALVPTYNNPSTDAAALAAYRNAGYQAIGIDCRRIIQWAGAIHCITITVPR